MIEKIINFKCTTRLTTIDIAQVYNTVLSIHGMNDTVKIDLRISRKSVLILDRIIERGLSVKRDEKSPNILSAVPEEELKELILLQKIV